MYSYLYFLFNNVFHTIRCERHDFHKLTESIEALFLLDTDKKLYYRKSHTYKNENGKDIHVNASGLLQAEYNLVRPVLIENQFAIIVNRRATTINQGFYLKIYLKNHSFNCLLIKLWIYSRRF